MREKISFLVIGGSAAILYLVIASLLHKLGASPTLASIISSVICVGPAYLGQYRLTFRSNMAHQISFIRYVVTQAFGLSAAALVTFLTTNILGMAALLGFFFAAIVAATLTYFIQKVWVFPNRNQANES